MTAKEMALDCAVWQYPDEEHNIEISYYKFTSKEFDAFCEQLCREQRAITYTNFLPNPYKHQVDKLVEIGDSPDWGQKGGE